MQRRHTSSRTCPRQHSTTLLTDRVQQRGQMSTAVQVKPNKSHRMSLLSPRTSNLLSHHKPKKTTKQSQCQPSKALKLKTSRVPKTL